MTDITFYSQDNEISLEAKGHTGFSTAGTDIVCAAISVLLQTLAAHLEENADHCDYEIQDGYLFIYAKGGETRSAFDTVFTGLNLIAASYPDYIDIVRGCTLQVYPSLI